MLKKCYVIPTEKLCNANCFFCITKQFAYCKGDFIDSRNPQFQQTLEQLARREIKYYEITGGGEPFLNDQLQDIIDSIRNRISDAYIKLYTNGSIHKNIKGINELDISTVHWDIEKVNAVYKTKIPRDLLSDLRFFYHPEKYDIRLSVPIFKGGIDNEHEAKELIRVTDKYVNRYVFRPLLEKTDNYQKLYVDFEFLGENIEIDRKCSCFSKVLLWWTDNNLYADWELREKILESV